MACYSMSFISSQSRWPSFESRPGIVIIVFWFLFYALTRVFTDIHGTSQGLELGTKPPVAHGVHLLKLREWYLAYAGRDPVRFGAGS
jgi:hypothetical protein